MDASDEASPANAAFTRACKVGAVRGVGDGRNFGGASGYRGSSGAVAGDERKDASEVIWKGVRSLTLAVS